jgi:acetate kinase
MKSILVANIGSTSYKFRLFAMPEERLLARGGAERIGDQASPWKLEIVGSDPVSGETAFPNHEAAFGFLGEKLKAAGLADADSLAAVGFKPVMAKDVSGTQYLEEPVLQAMEALYTMLPAHNPPYVKGVRAFRKVLPETPMIGTFETAFYDKLPTAATRFPVPLSWQNGYGIRRTGFHGASHRFVTERAADLLQKPGARIISCHLGGSSSICAVRDGHAVDSSWGMTPQSGLPQNNRVGDFDVFAAIHLVKDLGLSIDELEAGLSREAGLKGMSGLDSGDLRDIAAAAEAGNADAISALEVYVQAIRGYIGRFLVTLNGADALVFTAGIGENQADLRSRICAGMDFCGLKLDPSLNEVPRGTEAKISASDSKIAVYVIPTNEELVIARNAWQLLHTTS